MNYTKEQELIINHDLGHAMVSACPGSGKTTTLAGLIKNLILKEHDPRSMLVLMFGKDAQQEFISKLNGLVNNKDITLPEIRTYHSIGYSLCRALEKRGDLKPSRLEDSEKALEMMAMESLKRVMTHNQFKQYQDQDNKIVELFVGFVDLVKSGLLPPSEVFENYDFKKSIKHHFCEAFEVFEELRADKQIRFFSDLLYDPVKLLIKRPDLKEWLGNKKDFIIVDEFQDTNHIQYELLKIVAGNRASVVVVGDINQSIFEFRGSDVYLMGTQFEEDFSSLKKYSLTETFRYGHELALMANSLISNNNDFNGNLCQPNIDNPKTQVDLISTNNPGKEALKIIKMERAKGISLKDIAIVCRLYSSAAPIELELLSSGIPCGTSSGFGILKSKEYLVIKTLLEMASGKFTKFNYGQRKEKIENILKYPHLGVKNDSISYISGLMAKENGSYGFSLRRVRVKGIKKYQIGKIQNRGWSLSALESSGKSAGKSSDILNSYIDETDWMDNISSMALSKSEASEAIDRIRFIVDFIRKNDGSPSQVLTKLEKLSDVEKDFRNSIDKVLITSVHKAKGLEWPVVIMPGLDKDRFPYQVKGEYMVQAPEESERRLFYVGMTRAINNLYLISLDDLELKKIISKNDSEESSLLQSIRSGSSKFIFELLINSSKKKALNIYNDSKNNELEAI